MAIDQTALPSALPGLPAEPPAPEAVDPPARADSTSTSGWMRVLADRYARLRADRPGEPLAVVFDIDGTILDLRHHMRHVLLWFDREQGSEWFVDLTVDDIDVHENHIEDLLERLGLPDDVRDRALVFYRERFWDADAILAAHRPYVGVLEIIRWFQLQRDTVVALNTGRPERLRGETLRSLNALGKEYKVQFTDELLFMNPGDWEQDVAAAKAEALVTLRSLGFRIVAVVDNEPANLAAMAEVASRDEALLLHATTLYESRRRPIARLVEGADYDLTDFLGPGALPRHVQLVWEGLDTTRAVDRFLGSAVTWGAIAVEGDPLGRPVVAPLDAQAPERGTARLPLADWLRRINGADRCVRLELREGGELVERVLEQLDRHLLTDHRIWLGGAVDVLHEAGFGMLRDARPASTLSCPIDFLAPLIVGAPEHARDILALFRSWGLTRFSVRWGTPARRDVLDRVEAWGHEIDLTGVTDLRSFLAAAVLVPRSITARLGAEVWPRTAPAAPADWAIETASAPVGRGSRDRL